MQTRTKRILGTVSALVVAAFALVLWLTRTRTIQPTGDITTGIFGSAEVRSVFATAETVTVQRLHWRHPPANPHNLGSYDHGAPTPVPATTVRQLRALFQQTDSFDWNSAKACAPDYGVLFTFHSPQREVQLALCFQCAIFGTYDAGSRVNAEEDFDPMAEKLIQLIKPLFPNDSDIQNLK
jgi:hypothetical protein